MQQNKDILSLSVPKLIAKYAIPTILSQMVTVVYNLADTFFVGHTNDPAEIAGVTLSFPLFMCLTMLSNLFGIGANSFISRSLGQGKREQASHASTFAFYGALLSTLLYIVILSMFMRPILTAVGAVTEEAFQATRAYLTWTVLLGGVPTVAAMMMGHLIRSEGNTKKASIGMALGGILNIILDFVCVPVLGLGAEGAAIATCVSNVASMLYLLHAVLRNRETVVVLNPASFRVDTKIAKQVILVGIPAAIVIVLGSSANIVLTHLISDYGDVSIAAFGIIQKVGTTSVQITVGLTYGIMPLLGFCYGSRELRRLREINRAAFLITGIYAALCIILVELLAKPLVTIFTTEPVTVAKGVEFLRIWFLCIPGMCFTNLFCSIFQAMGKWIHSLSLSVLRQAGILIPLLIVMNNLLGEIGLMCAQPMTDSVSLFLGIMFYAALVRKL